MKKNITLFSFILIILTLAISCQFTIDTLSETVVGSETILKFSWDTELKPSTLQILLNGTAIDISGFTIDTNNKTAEGVVENLKKGDNKVTVKGKLWHNNALKYWTTSTTRTITALPKQLSCRPGTIDLDAPQEGIARTIEISGNDTLFPIKQITLSYDSDIVSVSPDTFDIGSNVPGHSIPGIPAKQNITITPMTTASGKITVKPVEDSVAEFEFTLNIKPVITGHSSFHIENNIYSFNIFGFGLDDKCQVELLDTNDATYDTTETYEKDNTQISVEFNSDEVPRGTTGMPIVIDSVFVTKDGLQSNIKMFDNGFRIILN